MFFNSKVNTVRDTNVYTLTRPEIERTVGLGDTEWQPLNAFLPNLIKSVTLSKALESRLKSAQILEAVYSKDELMGHDFGFTHLVYRLDEIEKNNE